MKLRFSEVKLMNEAGFFKQFLVGGHPNQYNLHKNRFVDADAKTLGGTIRVSIQHHTLVQSCEDRWFFTHAFHESGELDADGSHFAFIAAYDELAEYCNESEGTAFCPFIDRNDVEHGDYLIFEWEATNG